MPAEPTPAPLVLVRTWRATPAELWALWTTAPGFASWWGPQGFRVQVATLEAVDGGALRYAMIADAPEVVEAMRQQGQPLSHGVRASFRNVRPTTHLEIVSVIDFLPGVEPYDSVIAVDFEDLGGATRMTTTLHPMHTAEVSRMQLEGYTSQLTKLEARFVAA